MTTSQGPKTKAATRTLIAGVGNIFFGDDGFGPQVVRELDPTSFPEGVRVVDYGIRGTHLAYDLLEGWGSLILVDTVPLRGGPGRVHLIEVDAASLGDGHFDPHGMDPKAVLSTLTSLGGTLPSTLLVGCEPAVLDEVMGLSPLVAAAVPAAVAAINRLVADRLQTCAPAHRGQA